MNMNVPISESINKHMRTILFIQQEENNNSVSNDQSTNDSSYANQVLQSLTQNAQANNLDTNSDSLLALAVALRTTSNVSPSSLMHLNVRTNGSDNRYAATSSLEKLLSPSLSDMDNLSINNAPHRTVNNKGKSSYTRLPPYAAIVGDWCEISHVPLLVVAKCISKNSLAPEACFKREPIKRCSLRIAKASKCVSKKVEYAPNMIRHLNLIFLLIRQKQKVFANAIKTNNKHITNGHSTMINADLFANLIMTQRIING